ncbi:MAG: beta-lactamase family protein [Proteobacteria bacterium]|nr:beta-lactamase family protein [Pseudomonadota bacterium]
MASNSQKIANLLKQGIEDRLYSGAQLVVSDAKRDVLSLSVGNTRYPQGRGELGSQPVHVTSDTLFDIASVTKPLSTATLMMCAVEEGRFSLDQKLISVSGIQFPSWLLANTVGDLLSHQTALPAWVDFHGTIPRMEDHEGASRYFELVCKRLSPRSDGKTWCYSDLGYILLGLMLERAYDKSLMALFSERVSIPLGLGGKLLYCPLHSVSCADIAATCQYMGAYVQGHPDDANARAMTHVAGHAGLFATAEAISSYVRAMLSKNFVCQPETVRRFIEYRSPNTPFALGWDRPTSEDSLSGRRPGENVIGHLGFTGCSVWIDLDTKRSVTLLTNRTHANSDPGSLAPLRREIYRRCWEL